MFDASVTGIVHDDKVDPEKVDLTRHFYIEATLAHIPLSKEFRLLGLLAAALPTTWDAVLARQILWRFFHLQTTLLLFSHRYRQ